MQLEDIAAKIRNFRDERDWAQFHNPKDMAIALSIEASELLEHFLWKSPDELESRISEKREEIEEEIADIGIYLTELADILGIDLLAVMEKKIEKNALKYPAQRVKGSSKKYNEYSEESDSKGGEL
ncbi:MAG: nucleotide pyrophosphohydrolase [Verrucomicrobiota bacterium]